MQKPITIPSSGTQDLCTNYEALLNHGIQHCQHLGGDLWTDYNLHDPGVTILQQLCYAITDLSYRTDFPVVDLLAQPPNTPTPEQSLFPGDRILTCNPVTAADYQKLLYDRITGVKNAWLVPIQEHPLGVQGLYEVQVETWEDVEEAARVGAKKEDQTAAIRQKVEQCMRSTRNLAEDIERVSILEFQDVRVDAVIEIGPQTNPVTVLAQVLFSIQNSLIPYPVVQAVDDQFKSMQPDQIWNGPLLDLGSLNQRCLKPFKRTVEVQEIANIILQSRGVKRVKQLKISTPPDSPSDSIQIKDRHVPRLHPRIMEPQGSYTISIEMEGGVKWQVDSKAVWARIQQLQADVRNRETYATRSLQALNYLQPPQGQYKDLESYFSIQHQFPTVYGLSKYGAPNHLVDGLLLGSKKERLAHVQQLKAYLLFFEQLLANYLSQLAHVGDLFSLDDKLHQSYFYQPLAHRPSRPTEPQRIADVLVQRAAATLSSALHYYVHVVDSGGRLGLASLPFLEWSQAEELRRQIMASFQDSRNYRIRKNNGSGFQLALHNANGDLLALGHDRFSTLEAARSSSGRWVAGIVRSQHPPAELVKMHSSEDLSLHLIEKSPRERQQRVSEIIACGTDRGSYRLARVARGKFRVYLQNIQGELIAEGAETFDTEIDAEEGRDKLIGMVAHISQNPNLSDTYIYRLSEIEEISKDPLQAYFDGLDDLEKKNDKNYLHRRNNTLNHLLARFGEQFDDEILQQLDLRPFGEKDDFYHELIRWKIEFLRSYIDAASGQSAPPGKNGQSGDTDHGGHASQPGLGSGRGQAFDYGATDGSNAVSGLERRLALLLGLHGHMDRGQYHHATMDLEREDSEVAGFDYLEKHISGAHEEVQDEHGKQHKLFRCHISDSWRAEEPDLHDLHHQFVFSSEDSGILRRLLTFGTNRANYQLQRLGDEYQVLFQSPDSEHSIEVHRAIGRHEAEHAISTLLRQLRWFKEATSRSYVGERLWVVEHVLLRPRQVNEGHVPVRISHTAGIHLTSPPLHQEQHESYLELILHHGQHHENYRIETDHLGEVVVALYGEQKVIAYLHVPAVTQKATAIPAMAELVGSIAKDKDKEKGLRKKHVHKQAHDDFYSHRISVLLPNWPARFQSNEFKLYAEQVILENSPAHLGVNCVWLSAHEARSFEHLHNDWKTRNRAVFGGKQSSDSQHLAQMDEASQKLKAFIQKLQTEQKQWTDRAGKP